MGNRPQSLKTIGIVQEFHLISSVDFDPRKCLVSLLPDLDMMKNIKTIHSAVCHGQARNKLYYKENF